MIFLKAFNRPLYLYRTLHALANQTFYPDENLVISVDGGQDENTLTQLSAAVKLSGIENKIKTVVKLHEENLGLTDHTKFGFQLFEAASNDEFFVHMEDDGVPCSDCLRFLYDSSSLYRSDDTLFSVCTLTEPRFYNNPSPDKINDTYRRPWYSVIGPSMFKRSIIEEINSTVSYINGAAFTGLFGVNYISERGRQDDCCGKEWLKEINIHKMGTFDWPLEKYFRAGRHCLYPVINRSYNIGTFGQHGTGGQANCDEEAINGDNYETK